MQVVELLVRVVSKFVNDRAPAVERTSGCLLLVAAAFLASCSSKEDASAANFERSLNAALKDRPLCTAVSPMSPGEAEHFLTVMAQGSATQVAAAERARQELVEHKIKLLSVPTITLLAQGDRPPQGVRILEVLARAGFVHGNDTYGYKPRAIFSVKEVVAMLNEKGMAHYSEATGGKGMERQTASSICYGRLVVDKVVRWSAPGDLMGRRVSEVEFTVKHADVPNWALPMLIYVKPERKTLMVLTSDGWSVDEPAGPR